MTKNLYMPIRKQSVRYAHFCYFDATPYLADQIFIRHAIRVWFGEEFAKEGFPYRGIFCHVRKKDVPVFESCMEELKRNMVICGYTDYEAEIRKLLDEFELMKGMVDQNENDPSQEEKQKETA